MRPFAPPPPAARLIERRFRAMLPFRSYVVVALASAVVHTVAIQLYWDSLHNALFGMGITKGFYFIPSPACLAGVFLALAAGRALRDRQFMLELGSVPQGIESIPGTVKWAALKMGVCSFLAMKLTSVVLPGLLWNLRQGTWAPVFWPNKMVASELALELWRDPDSGINGGTLLFDAVAFSLAVGVSQAVYMVAACMIYAWLSFHLVISNRALIVLVFLGAVPLGFRYHFESLRKFGAVAMHHALGLEPYRFNAESRFEAFLYPFALQNDFGQIAGGLMALLWVWLLYLWGGKRLRRKIAEQVV